MFNRINIYLQKTYLIDTWSPTEKYYVYHWDIKTTMYNINSHLKPLMYQKSYFLLLHIESVLD